MNDKFDLIRTLLLKYSAFGCEKTKNGATLIGHPSYLRDNWWIVVLFHILTDDYIKEIEKICSIKLPASYVYFLENVSNGLVFQFGTFYLYGYVTIFNRDIENRQPFDIFTPNVDERDFYSNLKQNMFIIGGYNEDGSQLYIDTLTGRIYLCSECDSAPLYSWECFEDMLISELTRLYSLYTEDGRPIDSEKTTLPI